MIPAGLVVAYCAELNPADVRAPGSRLAAVVRGWADYVLGQVPLGQLSSSCTTDRRRLDRYTREARSGAGVPPPVVCAPFGERWQVIDGTHRLRAARAAGVPGIPLLMGIPGPGVLERWPDGLRAELGVLLRRSLPAAMLAGVVRALPHLEPVAATRAGAARRASRFAAR